MLRPHVWKNSGSQIKKKAWKTYYERLLNVEFPWDSDSLPDEPRIHGPPIYITFKMVVSALKKRGKAGEDLLEAIALARSLRTGTYIVNCFKGKGDPLERGNF